MSTFTRYGFSFFLFLYGVYQLLHSQPVPSAFAIPLAIFVFWLGGQR